MAAKNDVTGDDIASRVPSAAFLENYDSIFSKVPKNCGYCMACASNFGTEPKPCPFCGSSECDRALDHSKRCSTY